jgi:hypothetical protein
MPAAMKVECEETMKRIEALSERRGLGDKYASVISNIRTNIIQKEVHPEMQKHRWEQMKTYLIKLDKYRKRKIFDYLPFMEKYWDL